jgi:hypothetical protein
MLDKELDIHFEADDNDKTDEGKRYATKLEGQLLDNQNVYT